MNLYKHQQRFLDKNPNVAMLVHSMGSGKTRTAIEWAKLRPWPALIVCPKGLKENWKRECEQWGLKKYAVMSKEEFKKNSLSLYARVLIVDEADHFFAPFFKSKLAKSLKHFIEEHGPQMLLLTGTPYRSSPWNIFVAAYYLGHKWNWRKFKYDFFYDIRMGLRIVPMVKPGVDVEVRKLVEKISDVFNIEDDFEIPDQVDEVVYTGESKAQQKAHEGNIEILPIVRFTRDHQIESGAGLKMIDDNKVDVLLELAEKTPKIAVVCRYREQLNRYMTMFIDKGFKVMAIHGDITDRSGVLDEVERSEKCVLLLQSATCEGYEAPSVGLMIFASMDYSYRNYIQMKARIHRINRLKKNVYLHLIAGDCDKAIMKAMESKQDFDVLNYYKGKENG